MNEGEQTGVPARKAGGKPSSDASDVFIRPVLKVTQPRRGPSGLYRDSPPPGQSSAAGIPLYGREAIVVAAVRKGYQIAEAQVDRSARLAKRLRQAGDEALGARSDRAAVDAAERLVFKSLMAGLGWLEAAGADSASPIKRFANAEYRLIGSLLGLGSDPEVKRSFAEAPLAATAVSPRSRLSASAADSGADAGRLQVFFDGDHKRAVRVLHWEVHARPAVEPFPLTFYSATDPSAPAFRGDLRLLRSGRATLQLSLTSGVGPGAWRAAVCSEQNEQLGIVEISI